jgi:hypothetical protein
MMRVAVETRTPSPFLTPVTIGNISHVSRNVFSVFLNPKDIESPYLRFTFLMSRITVGGSILRDYARSNFILFDGQNNENDPTTDKIETVTVFVRLPSRE